MTDRIKEKLERSNITIRAAFNRANDLSGGTLGIIRDAVKNFNDSHGGEAAASLAYYTLFSLFPLLLALVAAGSYFLDRQEVYRQTVKLVSEAFPIAQNLIEENLQQVLEMRGAVGLIGLAVTFWSGSGAFTVLTRNVNRAWSNAPSRSFLENRLVALIMVGSLAFLLVLSLLLSAGLDILSRFHVPLFDIESLYGTTLWTTLADILPWLFTFFLFLALYRWVPNVEVKWPAAIWAAFVVALVWALAANAFTWYVGSGLARYRIVYGSLGTVVALLFWVYLCGWIIIFGAYLSAAIANHNTGKMDI